MVKDKYSLEGFEFNSDHELNEAKSELRGINYIVSRTDMSNAKSVLVVYNRLIDKKLFKTPIGIQFLKELQDSLIQSDEIEKTEIKPIPVIMDTAYSKPVPVEADPVKKKKRNHRLSYKRKMINAVVINVILIIVIIAMFIISSNSKNLNIINYENRILDQYSSWEEELNERESQLNEREAELNFQN